MQNTFRTPRLSLMALAAFIIFSGCRSVRSTPAPGSPALEIWQAQRKASPFHSPNLFYAGISITKFNWKYEKLESWEASRGLIDKTLERWCAVPQSRRVSLLNPDREDLELFLTTTLPKQLKRNDVLLLYLGTHHLPDGELLLGREQQMLPSELVEWLAKIPNEIIFLGDVCYAGALEKQAKFPVNCSRIYASTGDREATELRFDGPNRNSRAFFEETRMIVQQDLKLTGRRYSLFGYLFVHALVQELKNGKDRIRLNELCQTLLQQNVAYRSTVPTIRIPDPLGVNVADTIITLKDGARSVYQSLKALLDQPEERISYEDGLFLISQIYHPGLKVDRYKKILDDLQLNMGHSTPSNGTEQIGQVLYKQMKIKAVEEPFDEDFLFHVALDEKRGRCSSLTALYLILGERIGLNLSAACLPEHIFVRTEGNARNIETIQEGRQISNDEYCKIRPWMATTEANRFYMRSLSEREVLATYLSPLGNVLRQRGNLQLATDLLLLSLEINPDDAEAWNNLGMVHAATGKRDLSLAAYHRALKINPQMAETHNNLGNLSQDLREKIAHYQKAVSIKAEMAPAWNNLSLAWHRSGNFHKAWVCANTALKLGYPVSPSYIQFLKQRLED